MNLIRFLSSGGRGLTKGAPPMGRYRLPDGRLIPTFGTGKNPFTSKTSKVLSAQEESFSEAGVTAKAALTQAAPPSSVPLARSETAGNWNVRYRSFLTGLWRRLQPVSLKGFRWLKSLPSALIARLPRQKRRVPLATSSHPLPTGPVQAELCLENVRVVRNDLTDTDYEVVRAETTTASPLRKVPTTVAVPAQPRGLGRLAERLFSQKTH